MEDSDAPSVLTNDPQDHHAEQNRVTQQHLSFLQAPFDLSSPPFSSTSQQSPQQQQHQQQHMHAPSASLSTPEAHWSASSNLSSAPELTLSSSEALDHEGFFDTINRPYTPSYNSASGFEGAFSDQDEYWSGAGSQFEGVNFDFGQSKSQAFDYDPETADNYNNLESVLLAAQSFTNNINSSSTSSSSAVGADNQSSTNQQSQGSTIVPQIEFPDSNTFREPIEPIEKSPFASPLLGATSPSHTRHSSFGSTSGSPTPALDNELNWMQSLGQRMTLREDGPSQEQQQQEQEQQQQQQQQHQHFQHPHTLQQQGGIGTSFFAPVFEEEGEDGQKDHQSSQQYPSYTYSQPPMSHSQYEQDMRQQQQQQQQSGNAHLPMLSINDTAMQDGSIPGQKTDTKNWQLSNDWYQNQSNFPSLSSYSNTSQANMSELANNSNAQNSSNDQFDPLSSGNNGSGIGGGGQDRGEPKRQDSYDPIRKFLRLDVDMGFVSQQQLPFQQQGYNDAETGYQGGASRKRSNSDFGPSYFGLKEEDVGASPPLFTVVPGGVTDKTPTALTSGVDWATEAARQRKLQSQSLQEQGVGGGAMNNDAIVYTMQQQQQQQQQQQHHQQQQQQQQNGHTMDPNLLQHHHQQRHQHPNTQQPRYNPASGPMRQREGSFRGAAGPYQHSRTSSSGAVINATPWAPLSPNVPAQSIANSFAGNAEGGGASSSKSLRRSHSASRHRRGAQSEDLSQLARSSNPTEFLTRITAPDGSLAPPNTSQVGHHPSTSMGGSNYSSSPANSGVPGTQQQQQQSLMNAYRTSHDRHHSSGSNRSSTSLGSGEANEGYDSAAAAAAAAARYGGMPSNLGSNSNSNTTMDSKSRMYSQTALPTYTSLSTPGNTTSTMAMAAMSPMNAPVSYPIVQVTTSATQAASASRRKNEAIHVCPIPGCGSTFTRKFNLNGHIRSHTGARPYECHEPGCGKSFARSFDLSRHEKLHAGIKPHNCESCGKAFARADALSRHLRNDAGNGGCAARFQEGEEGAGAGVDSKMSVPPVARFRSGSSASSSLDSQDELDRMQEARRNNSSTTNANGGDRDGTKREPRFKGYIL